MKKILGISVLVFVILLILGPFTTVGAGHEGVVTVFGNIHEATLQPGFHFVNPLAHVHEISTQTQTLTFDDKSSDGGAQTDAALYAASKDLQDVKISTVVTYHIDASKVKDIYVQYKGEDYFNTNVIEPIVREVVKSQSAQYTAEELVTKRQQFNDQVSAVLASRFPEKGAVLESASIVNFSFSDAFNKSIEEKVTAEQEALAAKNKLEQVKYEAEQRVAEAQGEADAIKIQSQAINAQGGADYVKLQAIKQWNGQLPQTMLGNTTPFINVGQ